MIGMEEPSPVKRGRFEPPCRRRARLIVMRQRSLVPTPGSPSPNSAFVYHGNHVQRHRDPTGEISSLRRNVIIIVLFANMLSNPDFRLKNSIRRALYAAWMLSAATLAQAQQGSTAERVASLKANLANSQALLKPYEWMETTIITLKGDEKSRQMSRCYHGADGKVQKVPVTSPPPTEKKRGLRGRIIEAKKEELTDSMHEAVALVKQYVPPDQARIQAAKDAGRVSITPLPGNHVRLTFSDYIKAGDSLILELDLVSSRPLEAKVATYLDSQKEPVLMDVKFGLLDNNATYPSTTALEVKSKSLKVQVENSGYRRP